MPPDPPIPPTDWLSRVFGILRGVSGNILELAKVVLRGQASAAQIAFFAIGLLGLLCIGAFIVFAALNQPTYLFISFALLAVVVLVLLCLMAWRMAPVHTGPTDAGKELRSVSDERDQALAKLASAEAELAATREELAEATNDARISAALTGFYEVAVDAISTHYQKVRNRFPQVVSQEVIITITEDAAAEILERRTLRVGGRNTQHFLIDQFNGTVPLGSFLDLGFKLTVHNHGERKVVWLPASGKPSQHEVLFVLLPPLRAGDPDLDFSVSWNWPEVFGDLKDQNKRKDYFGRRIRSAEPVPLVRLVFRIHESIPPIKLSNKGTVDGLEKPPLPHLALLNHRVYQWESVDVPDEAQVAVWLDWA